MSLIESCKLWRMACQVIYHILKSLHSNTIVQCDESKLERLINGNDNGKLKFKVLESTYKLFERWPWYIQRSIYGWSVAMTNARDSYILSPTCLTANTLGPLCIYLTKRQLCRHMCENIICSASVLYRAQFRYKAVFPSIGVPILKLEVKRSLPLVVRIYGEKHLTQYPVFSFLIIFQSWRVDIISRLPSYHVWPSVARGVAGLRIGNFQYPRQQ